MLWTKSWVWLRFKITIIPQQIVVPQIMTTETFARKMKYSLCYFRFDLFTVVNKKYAFFWDITPRGSCKNRRFGGI
jgi:hypothetical protein